jgi:hypothetical protein
MITTCYSEGIAATLPAQGDGEAAGNSRPLRIEFVGRRSVLKKWSETHIIAAQIVLEALRGRD